jgi:putative hydrolase of the HAD superfamily
MIGLPFGVTALLFDLDNTLFDRDRAFQAWARDFIRRRIGLEDAPEQGSALARLMALDAGGHGSKTEMFTVMKAAYPVLRAPVTDLVGVFREEMPGYCTLDDTATRLLTALRSAEIPLGIVTNGSSYQLRRINALGLDAFTGCVFVSALAGCRKPDAAIFLMAATCLRVPPEQILFVGDTPEADIVGAHGTGMCTAWLCRDERPWPAHLTPAACDLTVASLDELRRLCFAGTDEHRL